MLFQRETLLLADITNYSLKGLMAALGKGNGISKSIRPLTLHLNENSCISDITEAIAPTQILKEGDIVVLPSKVVALLEGRLVYGLTVENYTRCITNLDFALKTLKTADNDPLTERDQIGLDKIDPARGIGTRYSKDPNFSAYTIASSLLEKTNLRVDVVISDSDSGGKKGSKLIGCPTIIATPIGATKGLRLFYCMRVAVAAEATWNNIPDMPVIIVQPYGASRIREGIGELRYNGFLDATKEADFM